MIKPLVSVALLLLTTAGAAAPSLSVAYHRDDHAAPLYDACLYPADFRARYGLYLKPTADRDAYSLVDAKRTTLSLRLMPCETDSAVLASLVSGDAQVGLLESETVLAAVLRGQAVRIIAPLQHASDRLVVNPAVPATDWKGFLAWLRTRTRPAAVGYTGQYSMSALAFMQALDHERLGYTSAVPGRNPRPESAKVRLIRFEGRAELAAELANRGLDAVLVQEPAATWLAVLRGCRAIVRTDTLPPGRFEDRPGTVIAAGGPAIAGEAEPIGRFLELMALATHYANNRTANTLAAACRWLGTSPALESIPLKNMGFSSRPDLAFTGGIWNWYFALRLRQAVPENMAGFMEEKDWLGVPYDSLLLAPALDRAGARIIR